MSHGEEQKRAEAAARTDGQPSAASAASSLAPENEGEARSSSAPSPALPSFLPTRAHETDASFLDQLAPSLRPAPPADVPAADGGREHPPEPVASEGSSPSIKPARLMASILLRDPRAAGDDGALAALRTLPHRLRRLAANSGSGPEHDRSRSELLMHLAERSHGPHKARLMTAAAELFARRGHGERAQAAYAEAFSADPADLVVLRECRAAALRAGSLERARDLFAAEAELPISVPERALALCAVAEIDRARGQDAPSLLGTLQTASNADPAGALTHLLCARLELQQGLRPEAARTLLRAGAAHGDGDLRGLLCMEAGRILERAGEPAAALAAYERATLAQPALLGAALGRYRAQRTLGSPEAAVQTLSALEQITPDARLQAELARKRAGLLRELLHDPRAALEAVAQASGVAGLREKLRCAEAADDTLQQSAALQGWARAATGKERGVALLELARLHARTEAKDAALYALREAAIARAPAGLFAVAREALAQADVTATALSRAAPTHDASDALRAAAKLAGNLGGAALEREALSRIAVTDPEHALAEVLGFDAAAEMADLIAMQALLVQEFERSPLALRPGPALALLGLIPSNTDDVTRQIESELQSSLRGQPLVSRFLARGTRGQAAALLWLQEAEASAGEHAAFAAVTAGHYLRAAGLDGIDAYAEALDAIRGYPPACFALEIPARQQGDLPALERVHRELATTTEAARERSARRARLGLLSAESDANDAIAWLELAGEDRPGDPLLAELLIRLSSEGPAQPYADRLILAAKHEDSPAFARAYRLRAASALELSGMWPGAIAIYQALLEQTPDDSASAEALLHALRRGQQWDELRAQLQRRCTGAVTPAGRAGALEAWAEFESLHGDSQRARAVLSDLCAAAPSSIAGLRGLARAAMAERDDSQLVEVCERLSRVLETKPEQAALLRVVVRLRELLGRDTEAVLLASEDRLDDTLWHALAIEAAAIRRRDVMHYYEATSRIAGLLHDSTERASYALRAAETLEATAPARALNDLEAALLAAPEHPLALTTLARLHRAASSPDAAAEGFARAAQVARTPERATELFYAAGVLFDDELRDEERATAALSSAAAIDVRFADIFARLRRLLRARDDTPALLALYAQRLRATIDADLAAELETERAGLLIAAGDRDAASTALRAALAHDPKRTDALRTLAGLLWDEGEHHKAAEVLVQLARLLDDDKSALSEVVFQLGSLYDEHLRDARRAELAFTRAAALTPDDPRPVERLVQIWKRTGERERSVRALQHLIANSWSAQTKESYILELANTLEEMGEIGLAEQALEDARRQAPTSMQVLRAQSALYERQDDRTALALHLQRSCNSLRGAIDEDLADNSHWLQLIEILIKRGREDGVALVRDAADSCGITLDDEPPGPPLHGLGANALRDTVLRKLVTRGLLDPLRRLFREFHAELAEFLPSHGEVSGPLPESQTRAVRAVAELFALPELELVGSQLPVCVPIMGDPLCICMGQDVFLGASEAERFFLLTRAVVVAKHGLLLLVRAAPERVLLVLHALRTVVRPGHAAQVASEREQRSVTRELAARLPAPRHTQLRPLLSDLMSAEDLSTRRLAATAFEFGSRVALTVTGNLPAAIDALLRLRGKAPEELTQEERLQLLHADPALRALLSFAISEAYLEGRREVLGPHSRELR